MKAGHVVLSLCCKCWISDEDYIASTDPPCSLLTARFAGGAEEEDSVSVCLHHSVLLAAVPAL